MIYIYIYFFFLGLFHLDGFFYCHTGGHELGSSLLFGYRLGFSGTPSNLLPEDTPPTPAGKFSGDVVRACVLKDDKDWL